MVASFNWVDLLIVVFLFLFLIEGFGKRFLPELLELLSFLAAFVLSLRFYNLLAQFLQNNFQVAHSLANVLGFIGMWFIVESVLVALVQLVIYKIHLPVNKYTKVIDALAPIPALLRGLVFISILLVMIGTFPIQPKIKLAVQNSKIGSQILTKTQSLETPLKNVFGGITQDSLSFFTVEPKSNESVDLGFKTTQFKPSPQLETQMINLVNKERTSRGFKALTYDPRLQEIARIHSADMFTRGYFSHYSPEGETVADRAEKHGIAYQVIGENLAYAPNLELAHNGLMNSPGHRANILSPDYSKIGIGIEDGGVYGLMITQVFKN